MGDLVDKLITFWSELGRLLVSLPYTILSSIGSDVFLARILTQLCDLLGSEAP